MKKLLFIAYPYPPNPAIGSQRPYKLSKYFPQYGWEPTVLTVKRKGEKPQGIKVIETDYKDIIGNIKVNIGYTYQKNFRDQVNAEKSNNTNKHNWKSFITKLIKEIIIFPDERKGWYKFAIKAASQYFEEEKFDMIISTSTPVTSHLIARELKLKYKTPWIADLRDLWSQNHFYQKTGFLKYFDKRLELKTLSDADALVTVTNRFADDLRTLHENKKIICITNGYDPDDYNNIQSKLTGKFTITYTGTLAFAKRNPSLLFRAVNELIDEHKINKELIEIRFYTKREDWLINEIRKYHLTDTVKIYDYIPRHEVLYRQKESQLLLLLLDNDNAELDVYPAKVFEYFGAKRPIIALGGEAGIIKNLLEETNCGIFFEDREVLKNVLLKYYGEFCKIGEVRYHENTSIEQYSYKLVAERYSKVLNEYILK